MALIKSPVINSFDKQKGYFLTLPDMNNQKITRFNYFATKCCFFDKAAFETLHFDTARNNNKMAKCKTRVIVLIIVTFTVCIAIHGVLTGGLV